MSRSRIHNTCSLGQYHSGVFLLFCSDCSCDFGGPPFINNRNLTTMSFKLDRIALAICYCFSVVFAVQEYKLGLLIPYSAVGTHTGNDYNKGENFASAISVAVDDVNGNPTLLPEHNLTFIWNDSQCDELLALREQFSQINAGVKAFIGPGCFCNTAARNAAAFNMPIISYVSVSFPCF